MQKLDISSIPGAKMPLVNGMVDTRPITINVNVDLDKVFVGVTRADLEASKKEEEDKKAKMKERCETIGNAWKFELADSESEESDFYQNDVPPIDEDFKEKATSIFQQFRSKALRTKNHIEHQHALHPEMLARLESDNDKSDEKSEEDDEDSGNGSEEHTQPELEGCEAKRVKTNEQA
eukprot:Platyproteum_vivax@DN2063_c0_g1_i1.p1